MEENNNLNEMNTQQPIVDNPVLVNPVADMNQVPSTPTVTVTPESSSVGTTPVVSVVESPAPVMGTPVPTVEAANPVMETPVSVVENPAPAVESPAPMPEATPVMGTPVSVVENPVPVVESPAPMPETTPQTTVTLTDGNAPTTEEKKKAPVNIGAVIVIIVCCILGGYILYTRYGGKSEPTPTPTPTPTPNPVVTPMDDVTIDPINPPVAIAEKYSTIVDGIEYVVYLKQNEGVFYYLRNETIDGTNKMTGNYGKYVETETNLSLQSEIYFNVPCYYTSFDMNNGTSASIVFDYTRDLTANTLVSSDGQLTFTYQGSEEITNPLQIEELSVCDNLENAN